MTTVRQYRSHFADMIALALRTSKDPIARYRFIWFGLAFSIAVTLAAIGGGYAFAGTRAALTPQVFEYVAIFPGHIRTHGYIFFILAIANLISCAALTQKYTKLSYTIGRITGIGILFYSVFTAGGFIAAWKLGHQHYNAGIWWYLLVSVLSLIKVALPPPFRGQPKADRPHNITGS